jgi:serine/threonine protein phosphatase PrpC
MKEGKSLPGKIIKFIYDKIKKPPANPEEPDLQNPAAILSGASSEAVQAAAIYSEEKSRDSKAPGYITESLVASSSVTKKELNRDFFTKIINDRLKIRGVAIADGIGNNEKVEEASRFVGEFLKQRVENLELSEDLNLETAFKDCKTQFDKQFGEKINNNQFGTTAIVALEYTHNGRNRFKAAYAGNGAIWHIRGNFNHFSENQKFPWNCVNYLNPHSVEQNGKEALHNCISLGDKNYSEPACIDFSGDPEFGDIIMICTDGIYSYDQLVCSEDGFGEIWMQYSLKMTLFYRHLTGYFKQGNYTGETLEKMLNNYLQELKEKNLLDDDATLGLILSARAMEYQKNLYHGPADKS